MLNISSPLAEILTIDLIISCLFIAGGVYLVRGGTRLIFSFYFKTLPIPSKIPAAHIVAMVGTTLYLAPFLYLVMHIKGVLLAVLLAVHMAGWFFTIAQAWQEYYSIGRSAASRRKALAWIDFVLAHTFGAIIYDVPAAEAAPGKIQLWWICRDGTGMFLRMCHAYPLFLALGALFGINWHLPLIALEYTVAFAAVTTLLYANYNWAPWFNYGDDNLNWAEFPTGIWFAACVFHYIHLVASMHNAIWATGLLRL